MMNSEAQNTHLEIDVDRWLSQGSGASTADNNHIDSDAPHATATPPSFAPKFHVDDAFPSHCVQQQQQQRTPTSDGEFRVFTDVTNQQQQHQNAFGFGSSGFQKPNRNTSDCGIFSRQPLSAHQHPQEDALDEDDGGDRVTFFTSAAQQQQQQHTTNNNNNSNAVRQPLATRPLHQENESTPVAKGARPNSYFYSAGGGAHGTPQMVGESPSHLLDGVLRQALDTPGKPGTATCSPARPLLPIPPRTGHADDDDDQERQPPPAQQHQAGGVWGQPATLPHNNNNGGGANPSAAATNSPTSTGGTKKGGSGSPTSGNTVQHHFPAQQQQQQQSHHQPFTMPPQGPNGTLSTNAVAIVEFKMQRRHRFRANAGTQLQAGQYVIVHIDQGGITDAGLCIGLFPNTQRGMGIPKTYGPGNVGAIVRPANEEDCRLINDVLPEMEEKALQACHQMVHFLHLPFHCLDAEYQYDMKAVKIYYELAPQESTSIVPNVSRLQRELGFRLKARVFLEQLVAVAQ